MEKLYYLWRKNIFIQYHSDVREKTKYKLSIYILNFNFPTFLISGMRQYLQPVIMSSRKIKIVKISIIILGYIISKSNICVLKFVTVNYWSNYMKSSQESKAFTINIYKFPKWYIVLTKIIHFKVISLSNICIIIFK